MSKAMGEALGRLEAVIHDRLAGGEELSGQIGQIVGNDHAGRWRSDGQFAATLRFLHQLLLHRCQMNVFGLS